MPTHVMIVMGLELLVGVACIALALSQGRSD